MTLLNLQIELSQTNFLLQRIAEALERAMPIPRVPRESRLRGAESIHSYSDESKWEREQVEALVPDGLSDDERAEVLKEIDDLPQDLKELIRTGVGIK
jgi:hypothetical protein